MVTLKGIKKDFSTKIVGIQVKLEGVNLEIGEGESIALEWRNRDRKINLFRIISRLDISFREVEDTYSRKLRLISCTNKCTALKRERIGFITNRFDLLNDKNVYENIIFSLKKQKKNGVQRLKLVNRALTYVNLKGYQKKSLAQLSLGELQRVSIARAIINNPSLLIIDNPTASLDHETKDEILGLLQKMKKDGYQFIIVTYDKAVVEICDKKYVLSNEIMRTE